MESVGSQKWLWMRRPWVFSDVLASRRNACNLTVLHSPHEYPYIIALTSCVLFICIVVWFPLQTVTLLRARGCPSVLQLIELNLAHNRQQVDICRRNV